MHQLILLRHAKAAAEEAELPDHERPLTAEGRRAASAIGEFMRQAGLLPDVALVSTSLRTRQTLEQLEPWDERPNIETMDSIYLAPFAQLRDLLREMPETVRSVLLVGHNPGTQQLAHWLAGDAARTGFTQDFPTAALAEYLVTSSWQKLGPGSAQLSRFVTPADLLTKP